MNMPSLLTNEQLLEESRNARERLAKNEDFKSQLKRTADAVRAEREYLFTVEPELKRLHKIVFGN